MTEAARNSLAVLRDPSHFGWWVIPVLVGVMFIYAREVESRNWSAVLAGLALWGMDWFNETINAVILRVTGVSALWTVAGDSAFVIYTGLNLEISLMFAFMGIACVKLLPRDRHAKILGLPNRPLMILFLAGLCTVVELFLNWANMLVWHYWFWNRSFPFLIWLLAYGSLVGAAVRVYDMEKLRSKLLTVGAIYGGFFALVLVFGVLLRWI